MFYWANVCQIKDKLLSGLLFPKQLKTSR
uniref:Uncharacterized protein n=1 Tax=Arundo donax TaxID=35708 RepID=A0A0A9M4X1_ARUDO